MRQVRQALQEAYDLIVSFAYPETLPVLRIVTYLLILNAILSTSLSSFSELPGGFLTGISSFFSIASSFFSAAEPASSMCSAFSATSSAAGAPGFVSCSDMLQVGLSNIRERWKVSQNQDKGCAGVEWSSPAQLFSANPVEPRFGSSINRCGGKNVRSLTSLIGSSAPICLDLHPDW
jgi:hypothetical protein